MSTNLCIKNHMLLAYADDVDIVGRTIREATTVMSKIKKESAKMGLELNGTIQS